MGVLALACIALMAVYCATSNTIPPPSINHANRSALFSLLYGMGFNDTCVAAALDRCETNQQESQPTPSVPPANQSVLFGLLHELGFSDNCVASALDSCAGVSQEDRLETLLKETRDLQQETRDLQQETRDLQQEGRDLQQQGRDLQQETRDLQQETRDLQQQGRDLQQETRDLQQETRDLQHEERDFLQETRDLQQGTSDLMQETKDLLQAERDLQHETRELLQHVAHTINKTQSQPRHCKDLLDGGDRHSGIRIIYPYPGEPERGLQVYCDQATDGRGWTVFQRRTNSTVREDFYRPWADYREGFGNLKEEFWLGLDALHALTSTEPQELRIDLADWEGGHRYAKYDSFSVGDHEAKYLLTAGGYSGTAGNSLRVHSGQKFTTHDSDNDSYDSGNCAVEYRGAWWYESCHSANLNGYQYETNPSERGKGIIWHDWLGIEYSLRRTTMMIRPAQQN